MISFSPSFFDARISGRMVLTAFLTEKSLRTERFLRYRAGQPKEERFCVVLWIAWKDGGENDDFVDSCMVFLSDGG